MLLINAQNRQYTVSNEDQQINFQEIKKNLLERGQIEESTSL